MTDETDATPTRRHDPVSRRFHRIGVGGLVLAIVGAATAFAALSKALYTSDETAHMDYAYQVWLGRLPVFQHGLLFRPPGANVPPVQWEAQHPPLFYLITAPVVGPLINGGHWLSAVLAGRACCVVVAAACIVALSWAGSLVSQGNRLSWAIAVPAVVSPVSIISRYFSPRSRSASAFWPSGTGCPAPGWPRPPRWPRPGCSPRPRSP
jgi:hypothetical protein